MSHTEGEAPEEPRSARAVTQSAALASARAASASASIGSAVPRTLAAAPETATAPEDTAGAGPLPGGRKGGLLGDPLIRLLLLAEPMRMRLLIAGLAGAMTLAAGIGLMSASGFLIARAAEHPSVTALTVAVVAVRALGISRGAFRYAERLSTHDVAFRVLPA